MAVIPASPLISWPRTCYTFGMTPKLTKEQHEALHAQPGGVVYFLDYEGPQQYAVIPAETFQKVRSLLGDDEFAISDTYAAQDEALAKVWNEPELDVYNDYDAHKPRS